MELIILTGMSGAGKSQAADFFEDQGFFCIDNLPPQVLPDVVKAFFKGQGGEGYGFEKLVFVIDIRSKELLKGFSAAMKKINADVACPYRIVFLEANDQVLVSRYRQTRRKHPLAKDMSLNEAIESERKLLSGIRGIATHVIDTSMMPISALREELTSLIEDDQSTGMSVFIESFGFKYGVPSDCDNVLDVRFLPNPFYVKELQPMSGKDEGIIEYLEQFDDTNDFLKKQFEMYEFLIPLYIKEGKGRLNIGVGCTGGRHRSVYIAEQLYKFLTEKGYKTRIQHRDIEKDPRYKKDT